MKALVWNGGQTLELQEFLDPVPAEGEVVLDVELAGICGSDLHAYRGHPGPRVPPLVLGHEVVGHIEGASCTIYPLVTCGDCDSCLSGNDNLCASWRLIGAHRPGVFAERVAVPRRSLVPLPKGLAPERGVLAEPLACCVGALRPHRDAARGRVLVLGCGPIGLLTVFLAAREGADVVAVDPVAERRAQARRLGARRALSTTADMATGSVDLVVDAAGFEATWSSGIDAVRNGGTVVVIGLGQAEGLLPMAVVVRRTISVRGQFAYSRADFAQAIDVLTAGDLELDWIAEASLEDGAQAFADLVHRPQQFSKVLLRP